MSKNGVLQGYTLSPYLFCLAIALISEFIRRIVPVYTTLNQSFSHQYFIEDLKVYIPDGPSFNLALKIIKKHSNDIGLKLNRSKCAQLHIIRGTIQITQVISDIPIVGAFYSYKYLGLEQDIFTSQEIWPRITKCITTSIESILSSERTRQKIFSINTETLPKLRYILLNDLSNKGRLNSQILKIKDLDVQVRKLMRKYKFLFSFSNTSRLYFSVNEGGLGLNSCLNKLVISKAFAFAYLVTHKDCLPSLKIFEHLDNSQRRTILQVIKTLTTEAGIKVSYKAGIIDINNTVYDNPKTSAKAFRLYH